MRFSSTPVELCAIRLIIAHLNVRRLAPVYATAPCAFLLILLSCPTARTAHDATRLDQHRRVKTRPASTGTCATFSKTPRGPLTCFCRVASCCVVQYVSRKNIGRAIDSHATMWQRGNSRDLSRSDSLEAPVKTWQASPVYPPGPSNAPARNPRRMFRRVFA